MRCRRVVEAAGVEPNWASLSKQLTARELWSQPVRSQLLRHRGGVLLGPRECSRIVLGRGDIVETVRHYVAADTGSAERLEQFEGGKIRPATLPLILR